jgi:hypothetical protein
MLDELLAALDAFEREGEDAMLNPPFLVVWFHGGHGSRRASSERHAAAKAAPDFTRPPVPPTGHFTWRRLL